MAQNLLEAVENQRIVAAGVCPHARGSEALARVWPAPPRIGAAHRHRRSGPLPPRGSSNRPTADTAGTADSLAAPSRSARQHPITAGHSSPFGGARRRAASTRCAPPPARCAAAAACGRATASPRRSAHRAWPARKLRDDERREVSAAGASVRRSRRSGSASRSLAGRLDREPGGEPAIELRR